MKAKLSYLKPWITLALFLTVLLVCLSASAATGDIPLTLGKAETLNLTPDDDLVWFSFSPEESGEYIFCSFGAKATVGYFYDPSSYEALIQDGEGSNFQIIHQLTAGSQYRFGTALSFDETAGSFRVLITKYIPSQSGDNWTLNDGILTITGTGPMQEYLEGGAPWYRQYVVSVVIENGVSTISDYAFSDLESLTSVSIPGSVNEIGRSAFFGCSGLSSLTIPSGVVSIGYRAFEDCTGLSDLTIEAGVENIEMAAFSGCKSLTAVTLPASLKKIGDNAFYGCTQLQNVTVSPGTLSIGHSAFKNCDSLLRVSVPESVAYIGNEAFSGCYSLMDISIPGSAHLGGPEVFNGCISLSDLNGYIIFDSLLVRYTGHSDYIEIPDSITKIADYAFYGYSVSASVSVSDSVTEIGDFAFAYWGTGDDAHMNDIDIPASVTSISSSAFFQTEIRFRPGDPSFVIENGLLINYIGTDPNPVIPEGVTGIGFCAFANRENLQSVTLPASLTGIGVRAFQNCTNLTAIHGGTGGTYSYYFYDAYHIGRSGLYRVSLPASVQFQDVGTDAFSGTPLGTLLTPDFLLPEDTAAIGQEAFSGVAATYIVVPWSVNEISSKAFANCTQLRYIYFCNKNCIIADDAFEGCSSDLIIMCQNDLEGIPSRVRLYTVQHGFRFVGDDDFGNG